MCGCVGVCVYVCGCLCVCVWVFVCMWVVVLSVCEWVFVCMLVDLCVRLMQLCFMHFLVFQELFSNQFHTIYHTHTYTYTIKTPNSSTHTHTLIHKHTHLSTHSHTYPLTHTHYSTVTHTFYRWVHWFEKPDRMVEKWKGGISVEQIKLVSTEWNKI